MNGEVKKFKAFTIIELMVVSSLTVITAGAVFSAIGIFDNLINTYQIETEKEIQLSNFRENLASEFSNSSVVKTDGNQINISFSYGEIIYQFESEKIKKFIASPKLRIIDSLSYSNISFQGRYGIEIVDEGLIDQLHVSFQDESVAREFIVLKNYSSEEKLTYER